jgi:hypothetical protein
MITMDLMETGYHSMDWILVAQDWVQWQDLVTMVIKFRFHYR